VMAPKVRIFDADEGDDGVEDEGVVSGDDSSCISDLNQSMKDDGWKVECLNEVVKVSESDEMSFDLGSSVEIVSCSGNDIAIETNSGSEQEVVFDCCGNQSKKMVDQKEREMVAMEADMAPEGCKVEYLNEVHELSKLNEMSNTVNESEPDVVDVYRTESKNRLSELEEEMTVTNVDVTTKHIPLVVMKVTKNVISDLTVSTCKNVSLRLKKRRQRLERSRSSLSHPMSVKCVGQSEGSKSWGKPVHKQTQMGLTKRYLQRETPQRTLPWNNQRKRLSPESKEMLRRKVNEIEAYNASKMRAAVKKKGEGSANTTKEKRARCYICRKRGHVFWKCPNKKNRTIVEVSAKDNNSKKPTVMPTKEKLKYPERVHVITDYMIEGTDYSNWDNIWYIISAYKKHMCPTKSLFKKLKTSFKVEGTQHEKKFILSHGVGDAKVETKDKKFVIPCVLYTPETTLNVLSFDQLKDQGYVVKYGHNKCSITYMFDDKSRDNTTTEGAQYH
ncbi:ARID DNA-binding domain-containing protein, partial [Tanacetum coccineum]